MNLSEVKKGDFVYVYTDTEWAVKCCVTASYINEDAKHVIQVTDNHYNMKFVLDENNMETTSVKGIFITTNLMGGRYVVDPFKEMKLKLPNTAITFADLENSIKGLRTYVYCLTYQEESYIFQKYLVNKVIPLENNLVCLELENEVGKIIYPFKGDVSVYKPAPTKYDESSTIWSTSRDILLTYRTYMRDQLEILSCHKNRMLTALRYDFIHNEFDSYFEYSCND